MAAVSPESERRKRSPPRSASRGAFGTARRIPALCVWLIKLSPIAPVRPDAANGVVCLRPAYVEPIAAQFAAFGRRSQCRLARTPRAAVGRGWPFGTEAGGGGPREWHWPLVLRALGSGGCPGCWAKKAGLNFDAARSSERSTVCPAPAPPSSTRTADPRSRTDLIAIGGSEVCSSDASIATGVGRCPFVRFSQRSRLKPAAPGAGPAASGAAAAAAAAGALARWMVARCPTSSILQMCCAVCSSPKNL